MSDSHINANDVVSTCYPKTINIVRRTIPNFSRYVATSLGTVWSIKNEEPYLPISQHRCNTTVGDYLNVALINDQGVRQYLGVHQAICLAFHPKPQNHLNYEVNHKDGNKHNNLPCNLEWMTRSENTLHAISTGLRNDNIHVIVKDVISAEEFEYFSIAEASRQLDMPEHQIKRAIVKNRTVPLNNRWLFSVDYNRLDLISRSYLIGLKAKDYVTGKEISAENSSSLSYLTGVDAGTIRKYARSKNEFESDQLISGYIFREQRDNRNWPIVDVHTAIVSRDDYNAKYNKHRRINYRIHALNYSTNEKAVFENALDASEKLGLSSIRINELSKDPNDLGLYKGYVFQREYQLIDFPKYTPIQVEISLHTHKTGATPVDVTDVDAGTTKRYWSLSKFAAEIGKNTEAVRKHIQRSKLPYMNKYSVKWVI